jgi:uncharacterized protein
MNLFLEILLVAIVVAVVIYLYFYFAPTSLAPGSQQSVLSLVCFKNNCFDVELAKTEAQRSQGLMYRKELDKNKGMLFIFDKEGIYPFWMKNTLIPLDMVWIDGNSKVVFIGQNVQPCKSLICPTVVSSGKAKYVLEINAGVCEKIGFKIGDLLSINIK